MKRFMLDLVNSIKIGPNAAKIGFLKFSDNAQNIFFLSDNKAEIIRQITASVIEGGSTNTQAGLNLMHTQQFTHYNGDRDNAPNAAIVLTDGGSTINPEGTIPEADIAKGKNITIFAIGIGSEHALNLAELRDIYSEPKIEGRNWWIAPDFSDLSRLTADITIYSCQVAGML